MAEKPKAHVAILDKLDELIGLAHDDNLTSGKGSNRSGLAMLGVAVYHQLDVLRKMHIPDLELETTKDRLAAILGHPGLKAIESVDWSSSYTGLGGPIGQAVKTLLMDTGRRISELHTAWAL